MYQDRDKGSATLFIVLDVLAIFDTFDDSIILGWFIEMVILLLPAGPFPENDNGNICLGHHIALTVIPLTGGILVWQFLLCYASSNQLGVFHILLDYSANHPWSLGGPDVNCSPHHLGNITPLFRY